jgi:hypothetical protein
MDLGGHPRLAVEFSASDINSKRQEIARVLDFHADARAVIVGFDANLLLTGQGAASSRTFRSPSMQDSKTAGMKRRPPDRCRHADQTSACLG